MGWIQKLYETYENCQSMIGAGADENKVPLLPICHTTQKAQIEIVIDQEGRFLRARIVPKAEARTIIPCTESSGGRTSGEAAHPLCDKLQYVAADYKKYGGKKGHYFESYQDGLKKWCEASYSHPMAKVVFKYIEKGNVVKDLVENKILCVGSDNILLDKWDKETVKETINVKQDEAFVRWIVETPGEPQSAVWTDSSLHQSWTKYYLSTRDNFAFCHVQGKETIIAKQHPRNIRQDGDSAKLISSGLSKNKDGTDKINDKAGFTFLGRFLNPNQAFSISFDVSQKSHNALRWLIDRQGYKSGDQAIVAWATSGDEIPDPLADPFSILGFDVERTHTDTPSYTAQELALKLNRKISGFSANLGETTGVVVMGIDSATPGRMAITFYRELNSSDFLSRIDNWHRTCCWMHDYRYKDAPEGLGKNKKISVRFVGAPAPRDITDVAYGTKADEKLRRKTVERILPCIIDGQKIPKDLVDVIVRRASNKNAFEEWEWNKALSIACALYRKYKVDYDKEEYEMVLEANRKTRDYLYGRLLALAEGLEKWALKKSGESRQTTAERLMQRFADHPYSTWRNIELSLAPYKARLGGVSTNLQNRISDVMSLFDPEEFISDRRLSGEFLLGYHCQREALWNKDGEGSSENI